MTPLESGGASGPRRRQRRRGLGGLAGLAELADLEDQTDLELVAALSAMLFDNGGPLTTQA